MAKRGPKPHQPTDETKKLVENLAGVGLPHEQICHLVDGCKTAETLRLHYREELDRGMAKANAKVAGKLFEKCMSGETAAILFWAKTRMGFRETAGNDNQAMIQIPAKMIQFVDATSKNDSDTNTANAAPA